MNSSIKTCFKCSVEKPLSEFYKHPQMRDGHVNKCKDCTRSDTNRNKQLKIEYYREYDRQRAKLPHRIELATKIHKRWKARHPGRRKAQNKVAHALKKGLLQKMPCFICGKEAEAHHPDYSIPLSVVWLCSAHHQQTHAMARKLERKSEE